MVGKKHARKKGPRDLTAKYEREKADGCRYVEWQTVPWVKDLGGVSSVPKFICFQTRTFAKKVMATSS